jgi:hypothetical protein
MLVWLRRGKIELQPGSSDGSIKRAHKRTFVSNNVNGTGGLFLEELRDPERYLLERHGVRQVVADQGRVGFAEEHHRDGLIALWQGSQRAEFNSRSPSAARLVTRPEIVAILSEARLSRHPPEKLKQSCLLYAPCPAVSQIFSVIGVWPICSFRALNAAPTVGSLSPNLSKQNLDVMHDFPAPVAPNSTTFISKSFVALVAAIFPFFVFLFILFFICIFILKIDK